MSRPGEARGVKYERILNALCKRDWSSWWGRQAAAGRCSFGCKVANKKASKRGLPGNENFLIRPERGPDVVIGEADSCLNRLEAEGCMLVAPLASSELFHRNDLSDDRSLRYAEGPSACREPATRRNDYGSCSDDSDERVYEQPAHPRSWKAPLHMDSDTRLGEQQTGARRQEEEKGHHRRLRVLSTVEKNEAAPLNKVKEGA